MEKKDSFTDMSRLLLWYKMTMRNLLIAFVRPLMMGCCRGKKSVAAKRGHRQTRDVKRSKADWHLGAEIGCLMRNCVNSLFLSKMGLMDEGHE
jgi:hypothetical protein